MQQPSSQQTSPIGGVLVLIGAVVAGIGCFLEWFTYRADLTSIGGPSLEQTTKGLDTSDGKLFLGASIVMILFGLGMLVLEGRGPRIGLAVLSFLGAAFVGGFGLYDALTPKNAVIDEMTGKLVGSIPGARAFIEGLFDQGILKISVKIGLWLVVAGAAVALIGAIVGLVSAPKAKVAMPAVPPSGLEPVLQAPPMPPPMGPGETSTEEPAGEGETPTT